MYKIYIDSSDRKIKSVTLNKFENNVSTQIDSISGEIDLVKSIETLLIKNKLKVSDIDLFESNLGPGSFTGLKLGATVSNVLNWANKDVPLEDLKYPNYGGEPNIQPPKQ